MFSFLKRTSREKPTERGGWSDAAVLITDVTGFTNMTPEMVVQPLMLREIPQPVTVILNHGGRMFDRIGNCSMATFAATQSDYAMRAVDCAVEIISEFDRWRVTRFKGGSGGLRARVAIASGGVFAGTLGQAEAPLPAIIGPPRKLAEELLKQCSDEFPIRVCPETAARVSAKYGACRMIGATTPGEL